MSGKAAKLHSGEAWREFCDRLKAVGDSILAEDFPQEERGRTEGYRALSRFLTHALRMEIESGDPLYPVMMRDEEPSMQWGGPNPDNTYMRATIHPDYEYRVWGNLKNVRQIICSLQEGDMQLGEFGVFSEQSLNDFAVEENGEFELRICREERSGNWMPMNEAARLFQIRIYLSDWENDASPPLHIERVGAEGEAPPPIGPAELAAALERSANWVEKSASFWNQYTEGAARRAPKNKIMPANSPPGGADNILYGSCLWDLADDEAIVMVCEKPDAEYWNFCMHTMNWLETGDMANRQVSLSGHQVYIDEDGLVRVVLSARDPGIPNWIDTQGRQRGLFVYRWVWTKTNPLPEGQVVEVDKVRLMMPESHPAVDSKQRRKRLARRRELYWNRYL